jgi:hypothetical protein
VFDRQPLIGIVMKPAFFQFYTAVLMLYGIHSTILAQSAGGINKTSITIGLSTALTGSAASLALPFQIFTRFDQGTVKRHWLLQGTVKHWALGN